MVTQLYEQKFLVPAHRITKLHHLGVDTSFFVPAPTRKYEAETPVIIGYCGRFDIDKGIADLIAAVRRVQEQKTRPVALRLLGSGSISHEIEEQAAATPWLESLPPVANAEVDHFLQLCGGAKQSFQNY